MPLNRTTGRKYKAPPKPVGSERANRVETEEELPPRQITGLFGAQPAPTPTGIGQTRNVPDDHVRGRLTANNLAESIRRNYVIDSDITPDANPTTIIVAPEGGDFTSIKSAVDSITDASAGKPYCVRVQAGVYPEAPFTVDSYIALSGCGGAYIVAVNPNIPLITMDTFSTINRFGIVGPANAACIIGDGAVFNIGVQNTDFIQGLYGVRATNGARLIVEECKAFPGCGTTLQADDTGRIDSSNVLSFSPTYAKADGVNSEIWVHNGGGEFNTNGLHADNGGLIRPFVVTFFSCQNVIRVNNNSEISGGGIYTQGATIYGILQEDASSRVNLAGGQLHSDEFSIVDWNNINITFTDEKPDDEGFTINNELHVGVPELGKDSALGEGDSYTRGMLVYIYDGAVYTDVSNDARSPSGSTFTFPNTNINTAIYVASSLVDTDVLKHFGIKARVNTGAVIGAGKIVTEYWDGASWTEVNTMSTGASPPYLPYAKAIFERSQDDQVRYDCDIQNNWAKNDDPGVGTNYFWVRFRIDSAITTAPVFEQFKLHTSRTDINEDGWPEYFGNARPLDTIPWDQNLTSAFGNSPTNQDLFALTLVDIAQSLGVGRLENRFQTATLDRVGFNTFLPFKLDTSCKLRFRMAFITNVITVAGNVEWFVNVGLTEDGDTVADGAGTAPGTIRGEQHISQIVAISTLDQQTTLEFEIDISEAVSRRAGGQGDILWLSVARNAGVGNDTLTGDVSIINISPVYTKWCEGGHV